MPFVKAIMYSIIFSLMFNISSFFVILLFLPNSLILLHISFCYSTNYICFLYLWGLSHEMDLAFDDTHDFITQNVYFSRLMRIWVGLIMFLACTLLLIGQQGMGYFFRYWPLLPIGWGNVEILRQRRRITTNTAPTTLSAIQAASQSTFIKYTIILHVWLAGMSKKAANIITPK